MQKWSPEPFDPGQSKVVNGAQEAAAAFAGEGAGARAEGQPTPSAVRFRREAGFASNAALLAHLTQEERATLFELVEIDVAEKYEARAREQEEAFAADLQESRRAFQAWADAFSAAVNGELQEMAKSCIGLAVQLAERILRAKIELDREVLVRCLETTLYKVPAGHPLEIAVNPEDAAWLEDNPDLLKALRIETVVSDRRISKGGCAVGSGGREWDATLEGQLEALAQMVQEQVGTLAGRDPGPVPGTEANLESLAGPVAEDADEPAEEAHAPDLG